MSRQKVSSGSVAATRQGRLAKFDRARIVVLLHTAEEVAVPCLGTAEYVLDERLGNLLRIVLEEEQSMLVPTTVVLSETEWDGEIRPDTKYGCDFEMTLSPRWLPQS